MLAEIVAPKRLRAGDPQALAALCAVAGWPVVRYCELAGAGDEVARAAVVALATFRRRAVTAGAAPAVDYDRLLLDCARGAVEELRGAEADAAVRRVAEEGFALASPRPLSPRLATAVLRALVEAAPLPGADRAAVRERAERSYAEAYAAASPAAPVAGEARLPPASALLARAAAAARSAPVDPVAARDPGAAPVDPVAARDPGAAPVGAVAARDPAAVPVGPVAARGPGAASGTAHAPTRTTAAPSVPAAPGSRPSRARVGLPGTAPGRRPRAGSARAGSRRRPGAIALVALAVAAVVALALVLALGTGGDGERAAAPAAPPAPAPQVVTGRPRTPLTASGARFEVVPIRAAPWARRLRLRPLPADRRWATIAVRVRNVARATLSLRGLGYRLRTTAGIVVGPLTLDLPAALERTGGRLGVGERASVHLGFAPPRGAGGLTFAFEPGGINQPTVLVPLGARP